MFVIEMKTVMINVRLSEKTRAEFQKACELRGASMSSFLHQFVVKTIREEKEREPNAFVDVSNRETIPVLREGAK